MAQKFLPATPNSIGGRWTNPVELRHLRGPNSLHPLIYLALLYSVFVAHLVYPQANITVATKRMYTASHCHHRRQAPIKTSQYLPAISKRTPLPAGRMAPTCVYPTVRCQQIPHPCTSPTPPQYSERVAVTMYIAIAAY